MVPELVEAALIDPPACSFRSCSQLANSLSSLLLKHLLRLRRLLRALPPPAQSPCILRLLINLLEDALIAAVGEVLLSVAQGFRSTCLSVTCRPW